jgi:TPR repeat protein
MESPVQAVDLAADAEAQFESARALHFRAIEALEGTVFFREDGQKNTFVMNCERVGELQDHADFVEAARRYKLAADQGHLRALISLSDFYDNGIGVAKNRDESMRLLALAADDLSADAEVQFKFACAIHARTVETLELHLPLDYDDSELPPHAMHADFVEAARRLKLAADQGHLRALISLSDFYDKGIGVAKSQTESMRLLALAAEQKQLNKELSPIRKFLLSQMYSNGWHVKIDQIEALRLMKLAAEENCPFPLYYLAICYDGSTAYDIGIWDRLAEGIKEDLNEAVRLYKLAIIHSTGKEFMTSKVDAKRYYILSDSQYRLALLLQDGKRGLQPDVPEAARLFKLAGEAGVSSASFRLAIMHHQGQGVPKNVEEAARLYKLAADQGDVSVVHFYEYNLSVSALGMLGSLYASGKGVQQDYVESARLYTIAAAIGDVIAQIGLGDAYEKGQGVCQDLVEAARWYCTAAEQIMPWPRDSVILGIPSNPNARAKLAALQLRVVESQFVPSAALSPSCELANGTRVRIEGLQSRPDMNGRMGVILGKQFTCSGMPSDSCFAVTLTDLHLGAFNEESGRWTIQIDAVENHAARSQIKVRTANIHRMEAGPLDINCLVKKGPGFPLVFRGDRLFSAMWGSLNPNALAVAQGARVRIQTGLNPERSFM